MGLCLKRKPYRFKDTFKLAINLVVAEPEYLVSKLPQSIIAENIATAMLIEAVLIAIDLND